MDIKQIGNDPEGTAVGQSHKGKALSDPKGTAVGLAKEEAISERRRFPRCDFDIPVRLVLTAVPEGNIIEEGSARACNISTSGIEVSDIELPNRSLPLKPFQIYLFIDDQEGLGRIHMLCSLRWINSNGSISLGLHIDRIPEKHRYRLNEFVKEMATRNIS